MDFASKPPKTPPRSLRLHAVPPAAAVVELHGAVVLRHVHGDVEATAWAKWRGNPEVEDVQSQNSELRRAGINHNSQLDPIWTMILWTFMGSTVAAKTDAKQLSRFQISVKQAELPLDLNNFKAPSNLKTDLDADSLFHTNENQAVVYGHQFDNPVLFLTFNLRRTRQQLP